jgi:hypothetical protein
MPKPVLIRYPRASTALAIVCAAFVTVATSQARGGSGQSSVNIEFMSENQRIELDIAPVEDRLAPFDYQGGHHLEVKVYTIDQDAVDGMRWTLSLPVEGEEPLFLDGVFAVSGEQVTEEDGKTYGDPIARIGRLCAAAESAITGCLPCAIDRGCSLVLQIDRCHPLTEDAGRTWVEVGIVRDDGSTYNNECPDGTDFGPCIALDGWMSAEHSPLDAPLCLQ